MFGVTILLNEKTVQENIDYLKEMQVIGATSVFTSLRVPEEDPNLLKENLKYIGEYINSNYSDFIVDVSPITFENFTIEFMKECHIKSLRIDNGISEREIVELSKEFKIIFNASTLTKSFIDTLRELGYKSKIEAWHNYYPKRYSGLDTEYFIKQNEFLKSLDVEIGAYIRGDLNPRGTIFEWLPTLEEHRDKNSFYAYLEMKYVYGIDQIIIGDYGLEEHTFKKFREYFNDAVIHLDLIKCFDSKILNITFKNRIDICRDAIRSVEFRRKNSNYIEPLNNNLPRKIGDVTMDNSLYGRYMGEIQIILKELPNDTRVNTVGIISKEDQEYLPFIKNYLIPYSLNIYNNKL